MTFDPSGTARGRFLGTPRLAPPDDDFEPAYLGWEIARCAPALDEEDRGALEALAAACMASLRLGSTRVPLEPERLAEALAMVGARNRLEKALGLIERAGQAGAGSAAAVLGRPGDRKPLIVEGPWLYSERMHVLERRFCERVRARRVRADGATGSPSRAVARAISALAAAGSPELTHDQKRAVRDALGSGLSMVTGGPGTGKTTTAVGLFRALAWMGVPMDAVAIAAPTGKAAQRLADAIARALAAPARDIAAAALGLIAPVPQTLHRLLGWSPTRGRFAHHENDPMPYRVVIVDEASMIDLAMMDRLFRALRDDARLVLFGDADQLPSVEAGTVFRDLCAALGAVRLGSNLRVADDAGARRIVEVAQAINGGVRDARFVGAVSVRRAVDEVAFEGVEHLAVPWSRCGQALLDKWWRTFSSADEAFSRRASRTYRCRDGVLDAEGEEELSGLNAHHARTRILCVTRGSSRPTGAEAVNDRVLAMLRANTPGRSWQGQPWPEGAPVLMQRNDYARGLYNGDQGVVVRVDPLDGGGPRPMAVFPKSQSLFCPVALGEVKEMAPAFAITVHKAQGSEFDHVMIILPDEDIPLLRRDLLYTAVTRARRSVLVVGTADLLGRAVARESMRYGGVEERLKNP